MSQVIEKEGKDITNEECTNLLTEYMKLEDEHKDWSRLKQTFWIKYLFRRCGILAASEKFNKNENLETI